MALNYIVQTWIDEIEGVQVGTDVDSLHMSHIEDGIKAVSDAFDNLVAVDNAGGTFQIDLVAKASTAQNYATPHIANISAMPTSQLPAVGSQTTLPNGTLIVGFD